MDPSKRSLDRSSRRLSSDCSGASPCDHREMSKEEWLKEVERREFYKNYNAMDGAITAIVLGGFFAFVCLLVVYKTKCKPLWKNRRRKLTNTPATQSNAEVDVCGEQRRSYVVEAAQLAAQEEEGMMGGMLTSPPILSVTPAAEDFECIPLGAFSYDGDIYYLDECGNYLFPVPSPDESALCSCSAQPPLEGALQPRRNSQSSVSNAYTVKSLPGAYLYIPLVDPKSIPLGTVKRSLSDPEIHFASPNLGTPLIFTVSPSSELTVKRGSLGAFPLSSSLRPALFKDKKGLPPRSFSIQGVEPATINIHITTPTPTVSPAPSINSFSANSTVVPLEAVVESAGESEHNHNESSPEISSLGSSRGNQYRQSRGFSLQESTGPRMRRTRNLRQLTLPASSSSSFLKVPEGGASGVTRGNSFSSILSEGDGDIFDFQGGLMEEPSSPEEEQGRIQRHTPRAQVSISDYSDLAGDELSSEISELCRLPAGPARLAAEEDDFVGGCGSLSSLDSETASIHTFTVPVTIEHPPPGLRSPPLRCAAEKTLELEQKLVARDEEKEEVSQEREETEEEGDFQLVLVRDIGTQVTGDSPSSSSQGSSPNTVKSHQATPPPLPESPSGSSSSSNHQPNTYVEKFPPEILF